MDTVRFAEADLELFAAASHDRNPLHLSAAYARRTPFGERVAFGVLGALAAIGAAPTRGGQRLTDLSLTFRNPLFCNVDYRILISQRSERETRLSIADAGRVMLSGTLRFEQSDREDTPWDTPPTDVPLDAVRHSAIDLRPGLNVTGNYAPAPDALAALVIRWNLMHAGLSANQLGVLLWCSYIVGMHLPGERALFSQLKVR